MYPIDLAKDGLLDIPTEHSAAEKLQKLRDRRTRFDNMAPLHRIRGQIDEWVCYDFAGGVFVSVIEAEDEDDDDEDEQAPKPWQLWDSILAQSMSLTRDGVDEETLQAGVATIQIIHLPNPHTGEGLRHQLFQERRFVPSAIAFDPSQDLLILLDHPEAMM